MLLLSIVMLFAMGLPECGSGQYHAADGEAECITH